VLPEGVDVFESLARLTRLAEDDDGRGIRAELERVIPDARLRTG
jgi:hypothetical protein